MLRATKAVTTKTSLLAALLSSVSVLSAAAQEAANGPAADEERADVITVTGWRLRELDQEAATGTRLGLSVRETPATIDQIDSNEMLTRGFRTVEEAAVSLPGVTSGGSPGGPSLYSIRGFEGSQVTVLHNGLYIGPSNMINRPGNTFNVASVDLLKGPASVLYGQGAIGGAVNYVSKSPSFEGDSYQMLGSFGTFDTVSGGLGGNRVLSDEVAARLDASYHRTEGFVDDASSNSFNVTSSILYQPSDDLSVEFSIDYLKDDLTSYFGTPLVPEAFAADPIEGILSSESGLVVDRRLRFKNYNVSDNRASSWQVWPRVSLTWSPTESVEISNTAYYFHAEREWINAESYNFNDATDMIDRDRFFVFHNQDLFGDQLSAKFQHRLGGFDNTFLLGVDYSHLDFIRSRGFPDGDSVDPFNPDPGLFGPLDERVSPTKWDQIAVFAEDVLELTDQLKLVTGIRAGWLDLTRDNYNVDGSFNAGQSFERTYDMINWRVGAVYDVAPGVSAYASYSTGEDPVGSNILIVNANQNFDFSHSRQYEVGVKADLGAGSVTLAAYDIKRDNLLTLVGVDTLSNVGTQSSRGVELSGQYKLTDKWTVIGSAAYVDAEYDDFVDPNFGIDATGNTPANVPKWVGNFWTSFQDVGGLPLEIGGGVKYVGDRYGNSANNLVLNSYATGIVYATVELSDHVSLTGRVNNVWDETYVQWADIFYPSQVLLAEPRRIEVSILGRF